MFMDEGHPGYENQPDPNDTVWRYLDLPRFISVIQTRQLYFSQSSMMKDKWEGAVAGHDVHARVDARLMSMFNARQTHYLNCWYVSKFESAGMWDLYQHGSQGVAIRSTWGRLTDSITSQYPIHGGLVKYIDYDKRAFNMVQNVGTSFMYKRRQFDHEREARLVLWSDDSGGPSLWARTQDQSAMVRVDKTDPPGYGIDVDLSILVDALVVAPDAPPWYLSLIKGLVGQFGHDLEILPSELDQTPIGASVGRS